MGVTLLVDRRVKQLHPQNEHLCHRLLLPFGC